MNLNYKQREAVCECGRGFTKKSPNHKRCETCRRALLETPRKTTDVSKKESPSKPTPDRECALSG